MEEQSVALRDLYPPHKISVFDSTLILDIIASRREELGQFEHLQGRAEISVSFANVSCLNTDIEAQ
jgi:hypothetical protein